MSNERIAPIAVNDLRYPETPLFSTSWWLDAVVPGSWDEVTVTEGDTICARMRFGTGHVTGLGTVLSMPVITPYLGPELFSVNREGPRGIGDSHGLVEQLITALPRSCAITINCHPNFDSWLPFHWNGFTQRTRYTHRLVDIGDSDRVFRGFSSSTRRAIRKAEKTIEVRPLESTDQLFDLHELTYRHQGKPVVLDRAKLHRAANAAIERDQGMLLGAFDSSGIAHAAAFLVWNDTVTYYLVGGSDPKHRSSGAMSLLFWRALQAQRERTVCFDFEGSMVAGIERFFRGFGAMPVPTHEVRRDTTTAKLARMVSANIKKLR